MIFRCLKTYKRYQPSSVFIYHPVPLFVLCFAIFRQGLKDENFRGCFPPRGAMSAISPAPQDDHSGGVSPTSDIKQKYKQQRKDKDVLSVPLNRLPTHATKTMILGYCRLFEKGQINLL